MLDTPDTPLAIALSVLLDHAVVPDSVPHYEKTYKLILSGRVTSKIIRGRRYIPSLRQMARELGIALKDNVAA